MSKERKPALVTFGLGGHTVYMFPEVYAGGRSSSRVEGYDSPETFEKSLPDKTYGDLEGCPVVDGCQAFRSDAGVRLALHAPLIDPGLEEPSRFADIQGAAESMVLKAFEHGTPEQRGLAAMGQAALESEYGGLDSVPVPVYLDWARRNLVPHGARIGTIRSGRIVWNGETA